MTLEEKCGQTLPSSELLPVGPDVSDGRKTSLAEAFSRGQS